MRIFFFCDSECRAYVILFEEQYACGMRATVRSTEPTEARQVRLTVHTSVRHSIDAN